MTLSSICVLSHVSLGVIDDIIVGGIGAIFEEKCVGDVLSVARHGGACR